MGAEFVLALTAVFFAGLINGLTGFGFVLVGAPFLLLVYQPAAVVLIQVALSPFTSGYVLADAIKGVRWRTVFTLLPFAVAGAVVGASILVAVNPDYIQLGIGVIITLTALLMLRHVRIPGAKTGWATAVAGFLSGTLGTTTGLSGPPMVLLLASHALPKHQFRGTTSAYLLALGIAGLTVFAFRGVLEWNHVTTALALLPAVFLGNFAGSFLSRKTPEGMFRTITLVVIIGTGILGAATALRALG